MPLNTIGYLVVILLLVIALIILTTRVGSDYDDSIRDNSDEAVSETTCQIRCNQCCNYDGSGYPTDCGTSLDLKFDTNGCNCNC